MRLIDADELIKYIKTWEIGTSISSDQKEFIDCINKQPTAFDADKVVEQLETRKSRPDWCLLKPLPEKKEYIVPIDNVEAQKDFIAVGWNACINEITGGNSDD